MLSASVIGIMSCLDLRLKLLVLLQVSILTNNTPLQSVKIEKSLFIPSIIRDFLHKKHIFFVITEWNGYTS